jgi:hypothetical protein
MKAILVATAIFLALNAYARATTIVVIWGPADIVMGADGKLTPMVGTEREVICKIGTERNVIWAASGGITFSDNTSVTGLVNAEMNKGLAIQRTLDNIIAILSRKLTVALITDKSMGNFNMIKDRLYINIIFSYFESGTENIEVDRIKLPAR